MDSAAHRERYRGLIGTLMIHRRHNKIIMHMIGFDISMRAR